MRIWVICGCGCRGRIERSKAVGVNGQWARREHLSRLLAQRPSPRQILLALERALTEEAKPPK